MTPTFCWIFLLVLALVGRAASVPRPLTVDACALLCNPGAETESERERDPVLFPRYPKVNCKLQSTSDEHQAIAVMSHCLKLCAVDLTIESEVNCFALRSSLEASIGCYCDALTPLSPNTMRLHETWRLNFLVKELSKDVLTTILDSPLDVIILCEIREELFKGVEIQHGELYEKCINADTADDSTTEREKRIVRDVEESEDTLHHETLFDDQFNDHFEVLDEAVMEENEIPDETLREKPLPENLDSSEENIAEDSSHQDQDRLILGEHGELQSCKKLCKNDPQNQICPCEIESES